MLQECSGDARENRHPRSITEHRCNLFDNRWIMNRSLTIRLTSDGVVTPPFTVSFIWKPSRFQKNIYLIDSTETAVYDCPGSCYDYCYGYDA